jgi:integrase
MTSNTASRLPADGKPATGADLIAAIKAAPDLSAREKRDWPWSLRAFCRVGSRTPEVVSIDPASIRRLVARAAPKAHGLSDESWANARSGVNKALEWAGRIGVPRQSRRPLAPAYAALWARLPSEPWKNGLRRLFHYCSEQDIPPEAVDDAVLAAYHQALVEASRVDDPWDSYRAAAKTWNRLGDVVPDWQGATLTVPSKVVPFVRPWSDFPTSLLADFEGYCRRAAGRDLMAGHFGRPQSPRTLETRRKQLRWLATAELAAGTPADALVDLRALVEPTRVAAAFELMRERRGVERFPHLIHIADFLPTLARRIGAPGDVIETLKQIRAKLGDDEPVGLAERHRATLERFNDPKAVVALLTLPEVALQAVVKAKTFGVRQVLGLQSALAVQLLINAPVRVRNLAAIEPGRHIVTVDSEGTRHLRFPRREVKNRIDVEYALTEETSALLDLYLDHRGVLGYADDRFLFPGDGPEAHKSGESLSKQINAFVFAHTGLEMPAHRFRHALAKIFLDRHPGQYETVRQFLGHRDIETTIRFYAGAETLRASAHYNETILGLKEARHG